MCVCVRKRERARTRAYLMWVIDTVYVLVTEVGVCVCDSMCVSN